MLSDWRAGHAIAEGYVRVDSLVAGYTELVHCVMVEAYLKAVGRRTPEVKTNEAVTLVQASQQGGTRHQPSPVLEGCHSEVQIAAVQEDLLFVHEAMMICVEDTA